MKYLLKIIVCSLLVIINGVQIMAFANEQTITKIKDYQFNGHKVIIETIDNRKFYFTLNEQKHDRINRLLYQLSLLKKDKDSVFIVYKNSDIISIKGMSCDPLEFLKEDDKLIYMGYGIAPGVIRIDKNNDILYNKYLELSDIIKANSFTKNKKYIEYASTNEGVIEHISGLCQNTETGK